MKQNKKFLLEKNVGFNRQLFIINSLKLFLASITENFYS